MIGMGDDLIEAWWWRVAGGVAAAVNATQSRRSWKFGDVVGYGVWWLLKNRLRQAKLWGWSAWRGGC